MRNNNEYHPTYNMHTWALFIVTVASAWLTYAICGVAKRIKYHRNWEREKAREIAFAAVTASEAPSTQWSAATNSSSNSSRNTNSMCLCIDQKYQQYKDETQRDSFIQRIFSFSSHLKLHHAAMKRICTWKIICARLRCYFCFVICSTDSAVTHIMCMHVDSFYSIFLNLNNFFLLSSPIPLFAWMVYDCIRYPQNVHATCAKQSI